MYIVHVRASRARRKTVFACTAEETRRPFARRPINEYLFYIHDRSKNITIITWYATEIVVPIVPAFPYSSSAASEGRRNASNYTPPLPDGIERTSRAIEVGLFGAKRDDIRPGRTSIYTYVCVVQYTCRGICAPASR